MKKILALPNVRLLLALVALVLAYPFLDRIQSGRVAVIAFDWAILVLALRAASATGVEIRLGFALLVPTILLQGVAAMTGVGYVFVLGMLFQAFLHAFVIVCLFRYVLRDEVMTLDELFAAGSLYAMLAFVFAYLYAIVDAS